MFTNQILTLQPKLTSISLDDILKLKTKTLHAIPFIRRVEFSIPSEPLPERRKRNDAPLSWDGAEPVIVAKLHQIEKSHVQ